MHKVLHMVVVKTDYEEMHLNTAAMLKICCLLTL